MSRPSRTQQLEKPKLLSKLKAEGRPSVEVPEEFKKKYAALVILCRYRSSFRVKLTGLGQLTRCWRQKKRKGLQRRKLKIERESDQGLPNPTSGVIGVDSSWHLTDPRIQVQSLNLTRILYQNPIVRVPHRKVNQIQTQPLGRVHIQVRALMHASVDAQGEEDLAPSIPEALD